LVEPESNHRILSPRFDQGGRMRPTREAGLGFVRLRELREQRTEGFQLKVPRELRPKPLEPQGSGGFALWNCTLSQSLLVPRDST
jgi:hypothetical protein